jgi:predicted transcriptional regulator
MGELTMSTEQIKTFETRDEAITFLYNNPDFTGSIRVMEERGVEPRDLSGKDETSYNPDLPVRRDDETHRALWLLNENNADSPTQMLSNADLRKLSIKNNFNASPATSALLKAGYINRRDEGRRAYFYVTVKGKRLLRNLGTPASEMPGSNVLEV